MRLKSKLFTDPLCTKVKHGNKKEKANRKFYSVFIINLKWNCIVFTVDIFDSYTSIYTDCKGIDFTKFQCFKGSREAV